MTNATHYKSMSAWTLAEKKKLPFWGEAVYFSVGNVIWYNPTPHFYQCTQRNVVVLGTFSASWHNYHQTKESSTRRTSFWTRVGSATSCGTSWSWNDNKWGTVRVILYIACPAQMRAISSRSSPFDVIGLDRSRRNSYRCWRMWHFVPSHSQFLCSSLAFKSVPQVVMASLLRFRKGFEERCFSECLSLSHCFSFSLRSIKMDRSWDGGGPSCEFECVGNCSMMPVSTPASVDVPAPGIPFWMQVYKCRSDPGSSAYSICRGWGTSTPSAVQESMQLSGGDGFTRSIHSWLNTEGTTRSRSRTHTSDVRSKSSGRKCLEQICPHFFGCQSLPLPTASSHFARSPGSLGKAWKDTPGSL